MKYCDKCAKPRPVNVHGYCEECTSGSCARCQPVARGAFPAGQDCPKFILDPLNANTCLRCYRCKADHAEPAERPPEPSGNLLWDLQTGRAVRGAPVPTEPSAAAIDAAYAVSERAYGEGRTDPLVRALRAAYAVDSVSRSPGPLQNLPLPPSLEGDSPERLLHELWAAGAHGPDRAQYEPSMFREAFQRIAYRIVLDSATPEQLAALGLKVMVSK